MKFAAVLVINLLSVVTNVAGVAPIWIGKGDYI